MRTEQGRLGRASSEVEDDRAHVCEAKESVTEEGGRTWARCRQFK